MLLSGNNFIIQCVVFAARLIELICRIDLYGYPAVGDGIAYGREREAGFFASCSVLVTRPTRQPENRAISVFPSD